MLNWPRRARAALTYLFRPLQDIDVFVEDIGDEVFYNELFKRIAPSSARIVRAFPVGNRTAVIERARTHDFQGRPALFVVDGDFEWVRNEPPPDIRGVHRLDAYCIENLLIHEEAAIQLVVEECAVTASEAKTSFDFSTWVGDIRGSLVDLFVWFAVLNALEAKEPTVGLGVGKIITSPKKKGLPALDHLKVETLRRKTEAKAVGAARADVAHKLHREVSARVTALSRPIDAVSGKDFLLPLFEFRLWSYTPGKTRRQSLRIRLARHCDPALFSAVTSALDAAMRST
jgi:hypothetical protein